MRGVDGSDYDILDEGSENGGDVRGGLEGMQYSASAAFFGHTVCMGDVRNLVVWLGRTHHSRGCIWDRQRKVKQAWYLGYAPAWKSMRFIEAMTLTN